MKQTKIALVYDFDKTLSTNDMEAFGFIQGLGMTEDEFWGKCAEFSAKHESDSVLTYMYLMVKYSKEKHFPLSKQSLKNCGKEVQFFKGVETWFERINDFGKQNNVKVEHYVISSGLKEIIEGTSISKYFTQVFAGYFAYENDIPVWPALALNYTSKTQFLYRINKGILDIKDNKVNEEMNHDDRIVPFSNIVYIGDSETDIPCMRLLQKNGGTAIGLYQSNTTNEQYLRDLQKRERIDFVAEANYCNGSELDEIVKELIKKVEHESNLTNIRLKQKHF